MSKNILWGKRAGKRHYTCYNERGASVEVGMGEGQFSPGQLLKIALATCGTLSSDSRLAAALGDDFDATFGVEGTYDEETDRFTSMVVEVVTDLSKAENKEQLVERAHKAIERYCTVGHTLNAGLPTEVKFTEE
ncbi:MAG: OsmC family protein [Actinomycetaceae bacterium]|nr:OsmC family protein [Actinomycetaceae bacterium]